MIFEGSKGTTIYKILANTSDLFSFEDDGNYMDYKDPKKNIIGGDKKLITEITESDGIMTSTTYDYYTPNNKSTYPLRKLDIPFESIENCTYCGNNTSETTANSNCDAS